MNSENKKNENNDYVEKVNCEWKDLYNILNENLHKFNENERAYLFDLLKKGELDKFREYYWKLAQQEKMNYSDKAGDIFINENNKIDELIKEQKHLREIMRSYTKRLLEAEESKATLHLRNENLEKLNSEKEAIIEQAVSRIKQLEASNSELQSRVQQERIDEKIPGYVDSVKSELSSDDLYFIKMSQVWAFTGCIFGLLAVCASFYTLYATIDFNNVKGFELFYFFTRGLIGISILSWLAYICLGNSKKYTHESILRKDRRHALMFGQVFLQIYGSTSTKEDAVLVFKDWNMSGNSAFSDKTELPPGIQSLWDSTKEKLKPSTAEKAQE
ncbi:hypothetical protein [Escherichia coli]|uniref:hypothetical protein n=1 Tax=Escherichia coli TaxID=562 RepID=UPI000DCAE0A3|nr:hypothetical protein [Escherichia coli]ELY2626063.1 hypothetical protein [Cronobacter sakazakii]AWZ72016.1 hypothetical protein CSC39_3025 [Escherichia coli]EFC4327755.1 hypothetical protein [Escherichia coli]EFH1090073.1 hypothetical protein [Escherichia coli]EIV3158403.1 hypothetical protein [Escherichia coli]